MNFGSVFIIVGAGAAVDALADINQSKSVVPTVVAAMLLLIILVAVGNLTGEWALASALGVLYLIGSLFTNYKHVPAISGLFEGK